MGQGWPRSFHDSPVMTIAVIVLVVAIIGSALCMWKQPKAKLPDNTFCSCGSCKYRGEIVEDWHGKAKVNL